MKDLLNPKALPLERLTITVCVLKLFNVVYDCWTLHHTTRYLKNAGNYTYPGNALFEALDNDRRVIFFFLNKTAPNNRKKESMPLSYWWYKVARFFQGLHFMTVTINHVSNGPVTVVLPVRCHWQSNAKFKCEDFTTKQLTHIRGELPHIFPTHISRKKWKINW